MQINKMTLSVDEILHNFFKDGITLKYLYQLKIKKTTENCTQLILYIIINNYCILPFIFGVFLILMFVVEVVGAMKYFCSKLGPI